MTRYKLEITNNKGEVLAKFETHSSIIFESVLEVLKKENLVNDQTSEGSPT